MQYLILSDVVSDWRLITLSYKVYGTRNLLLHDELMLIEINVKLNDEHDGESNYEKESNMNDSDGEQS